MADEDGATSADAAGGGTSRPHFGHGGAAVDGAVDGKLGPSISPREFSDRINDLFGSVLRGDGSEYPVSEVVRWVNATGGSTTGERINALRKGKAVELAADSVEAAKIAEFFHVPAAYFLDPAPAEIDGVQQSRLIEQRLRAYRRGTIPQRVYYLFTVVVQADGRPYPATYVARWINANGGQITNVYIQKLITGERGERPKATYLQWIGKFFGVGLSFFYDEDPPEIDGQYQNAIIMLRDPGSAEVLQLYGRLSRLQQEGVRQLMGTLGRDNDPTAGAPASERPDT